MERGDMEITPIYNEWVIGLLTNLLNEYRIRYGDGEIDPCIAKEMIISLIEKIIKPAINENPKEKINDLGKRKLGKK